MQFQSIFDNIPLGIARMTFEPSGKFEFANREFLEIFGFKSSDEIMDVGMIDVCLDSNDWSHCYNDLVNTGILTGVEVQLKKQDGSIFWASLNAKASDETDSDEHGWIDCSVENISARKLAENKNASQLESLRQASLSLTASLDLEQVLDTIAECALDLVPGMKNCHIFLYQFGNGEKLNFGAALWGDGKRRQPFADPRPNGLTMSVAKSGEPILVPDLRSHPLYAETPESWTGSIIGLPLKIGDRVVGVMNVSHTQPGAFAESDMRILRLLGDQAAIAIENAHLYEEIATEKRHLSLVYAIGKELAPSLDAEEILNRAIHLTSESIGGSIGMALLYQQPEDKLRRKSFYQSDSEGAQIGMLPNEISLGEGLPGWVGMHRQSINIPDIHQDDRFIDAGTWLSGMSAFLGAPIVHGTELMGVFALYHREPGAFSSDHLDLLQSICQQVGVALSNVGRYEQVQRLVDMLEVEQKRLTELVEHLPVGVALFDENYRPAVVNSLGNEILNLFEDDDDCKGFTRLGDYSIQELIEMSDEVQLSEVTFDGTQPRVFEIEIRALDGKRPHWILMLRDVTEDRNNQARIQMQDRLATVGQLAAGIAHDFNNIMATILVYSDLLRKDLAMIPTGLDRLAIIQQQVQRASSLIRQILDFSRRSVMERSNLDLLPFIKEFDRLLVRVLPETIRVELYYHPGDYLVEADPTRLQQVFMNLAVNARDAMPEGGILSFDIKRYHLEPGDIPPSPYIPQGEWISVSVGDTGSGIPPEAIPHIFEPFFTTKPLGQGTGLGLAQAYGIVKQHGGYIDVQSQIGEGTIFSVFLPALPTQQIEEADLHHASPKEGQGKTILVVEDDPSTLNAIQDLLEAHQYQVFVAENGKEALELFKQNHETIDMLVSDVVMPEMGGLALYKELHNLRRQVKILFVTGHPLMDESRSQLQSEWISWLQKPFSVPDFFNAIEGLLVEDS
jgi:PAS domain S-box-containing protein